MALEGVVENATHILNQARAEAQRAATAVLKYDGIIQTLQTVVNELLRQDVYLEHIGPHQEGGSGMWYWDSTTGKGEGNNLGEAIVWALRAQESRMAAYLRERNTLRDLLSGIADYQESEAQDMGCDAGNPDGGSATSCVHCVLLAGVQLIRKTIGELT